MTWIKNDCVQEESTLTFEINDKCTPIEHLHDLIEENRKCCKTNQWFISDLYNQLLDLNKLVKYLISRDTKPCYNLCVTPGVRQVVALKPITRMVQLPNRSIRPVKSCEPIIVQTSKMIWTVPMADTKFEVPILGLGNFRVKGDRLINPANGKDLDEYLPLHFSKDIGNLVLMGIIGYRYIGSRTYGRDSLYDRFVLRYQVYDKRTTVTKIYESNVFHWKQWADNKINLI